MDDPTAVAVGGDGPNRQPPQVQQPPQSRADALGNHLNMRPASLLE